jgi:hypothetical protein
MLMVTQLCGFTAAAPTIDPPLARYVGQFAAAFANSTTATAMIPIAALQYPADADRQLVVFFHGYSVYPRSVMIAGAAAPILTAGVYGDSYVAAAYNASTANIAVVLTAGFAVTEAGVIEVYEIRNARDMRQCLRSANVYGEDEAAYGIALDCHPGSLILAASMCTPDTATFTWSGLTEDVDADGGAYRSTSARLAAPTSAKTRLIANVMPSAIDWPGAPVAVAVHPKIAPPAVAGGFVGGTFNYFFQSTTLTLDDPIATSKAGHGSFKCVLALFFESDVAITGITLGGSAMTRIGQARNTAAAPDLTLEFWTIDIVNGAPSGNVVVTCSPANTGDELWAEFYHLYGVGSVGAVQATTGNGTSSQVSVNVAEGGMILAAHLRAEEDQAASWTGLQKRRDMMQPSDTNMRLGIADRFLCEAETGRVIQVTGSASGQYCTLAIAFNP